MGSSMPSGAVTLAMGADCLSAVSASAAFGSGLAGGCLNSSSMTGPLPRALWLAVRNAKAGIAETATMVAVVSDTSRCFFISC